MKIKLIVDMGNCELSFITKMEENDESYLILLPEKILETIYNHTLKYENKTLRLVAVGYDEDE